RQCARIPSGVVAAVGTRVACLVPACRKTQLLGCGVARGCITPATCAKHFAQSAEGTHYAGSLRGKEDRGALALRKLRQRLQVFHSQKVCCRLTFGQGGCNALHRLGLCLGQHQACFGLALCAQDGCLTLAFGRAHLRFLEAFGLEDCRALVGLSRCNRRTTFTLGAHDEFHGGLDVCGRLDGLQLDAGDVHTPAYGRLLDHLAHPLVDHVAAGERLVQLHLADNVSQRGSRECLERVRQVLDCVRCL